MEIEALVIPVLVSADLSETLDAIARRMWAHDIGALPVFDRDRLVGIITERDLVRALALGDGAGTTAAAHMTPAPLTAGLREDSASVAQRMLDAGVRHLPVVDHERVVGMVSARDLLPVVARPAAAQPSALTA